MSQNDLVIANQTFPATRADINSALQSLGSLNSGPSAPATTYANMMWYDTSANILKMRSEANDAWISIGTLDQSGNLFVAEIGAIVSGKTFSNTTFTGEISEETGTMPAGTTPAIDPANGTVQEWTLTGNSSPTDSLADGEFVELLIQDGTAFTITWPTITWLTDAGVAPTLSLTGVTPVLIQKVGSTLYGRRTGDGG